MEYYTSLDNIFTFEPKKFDDYNIHKAKMYNDMYSSNFSFKEPEPMEIKKDCHDKTIDGYITTRGYKEEMKAREILRKVLKQRKIFAMVSGGYFV